jgi:hypothetical protein
MDLDRFRDIDGEDDIKTLHKTYEEQPIKTKKERNNTRNQETTCMKEKNKNNF